MSIRLGLAIIAATLLAPHAALARAPADRAADYLYAGKLADGEAALNAMLAAAPDDAEVLAGLGAIQFTRAIERFAQAMYLHGLEVSSGTFGPLLSMPLPHNPDPQPLTYEMLRAILERLSADLDRSAATLARVGDREIKLPLAPGRIRIDVNGDGTASENEQLVALAFGQSAPTDFKIENENFVVGFDTADIYWLRGYTNLIASVADFWLAFDFRRTFDLTFHLIFPRAALPNGVKLATGSSLVGMPADEIADMIALIHLVDWPVVERARLTGLLARGLSIIDLNRKTWAAVRAESDDDREWLPSPRQKSGVMTGLDVTDERIDAWLAMLTDTEAVLKGDRLAGHWRFQQGYRLPRVLAEIERFDLVLWITGQAALPWLEDGQVDIGKAFSGANAIFDGNLLAYAFWFN